MNRKLFTAFVVLGLAIVVAAYVLSIHPYEAVRIASFISSAASLLRRFLCSQTMVVRIVHEVAVRVISRSLQRKKRLRDAKDRVVVCTKGSAHSSHGPTSGARAGWQIKR